jgi:hypothetical protein
VANFRGKLDKLNVCLRIEDGVSGHVVASVAAVFGSSRELEPHEAVEIPFPLPTCLFPSAGVYKAAVLINNEQIGKRDLPVQSITAIAQTYE